MTARPDQVRWDVMSVKQALTRRTGESADDNSVCVCVMKKLFYIPQSARNIVEIRLDLVGSPNSTHEFGRT